MPETAACGGIPAVEPVAQSPVFAPAEGRCRGRPFRCGAS